MLTPRGPPFSPSPWLHCGLRRDLLWTHTSLLHTLDASPHVPPQRNPTSKTGSVPTLKAVPISLLLDSSTSVFFSLHLYSSLVHTGVTQSSIPGFAWFNSLFTPVPEETEGMRGEVCGVWSATYHDWPTPSSVAGSFQGWQLSADPSLGLTSNRRAPSPVHAPPGGRCPQWLAITRV